MNGTSANRVGEKEMTKRDTWVNTVERFSLGVDQNSGQYYFSIPVSNRFVDYEEYYEVTELEYQNLMSDTVFAARFAADCRAHRSDARLMIKPGKDRGV
jgi:hypothetical protein